MVVVAFPAREPSEKDRRFKVQLAKGTTTRLYQILPAGPGVWQCWIRANGRPYLSICTDEVPHLDRIRVEFEQDIAALRADGWVDS